MMRKLKGEIYREEEEKETNTDKEADSQTDS